MAKSQIYKRGRAQLAFNMTPMIDCVFQLIIFFMLTTQLASEDYVRMKLPRPEDAQVKDYEEVNKAVVNVVPYSDLEIGSDRSRLGMAKEYRLRSLRVKAHEIRKLARALEDVRRRSKDPKKFIVELRADKRVQYAQIEPLLSALMEAKLGKMHITAMREGSGE